VKRRLGWGGLALCAAATAGHPAPDPPRALLREVTAVRREPFRSSVLLTGQVTATRLASFKAPLVPGWRVAIKWLAEEGATVRPGDTIVRFDTGSLQGEYETTQIDLNDKLSEGALRDAEAAAKVLDRQLALERARIELEQARVEASVPPDVRALREHEEKQLALEKAKDAAEAARVALEAQEEQNRTERLQREIDVRMAREKLGRVSRQLAAMTVASEHVGVVVLEQNWRSGKKIKVGDQAWSTMPIAYLPDLQATKVVAFAGEAELSRLTVGQPAVLRLDAYPEREFAGRVAAIARAGEPNDMWGKSPLYAVDVALEDPDLELMRQGMSVRVEVRTADDPAAWLVPLAALRTGPGGTAVPSGGREVPVRVRAVGAFEAAIEPVPELPEGAALDGGPFRVPAGAGGGAGAAGRRGGKLVAQGTLTSRVKNALGPRVQGVWRYTITQLAPEGEDVAAGTVVAAFDPKELTDRLALQQSQLDAARKELEKTVLEGQQGVEELELQLAESKMKLEKAERKLDVPDDLVGGLQQSVERYDAELARLEYALNQRRVETARANLVARRANQEAKVARLDAEVQQVLRSIEAMKLRAPRAGCVVYIVEDEEDGKPRVGGEVWQGRDVIEIADLSAMEVDARVPEPDAGRIGVGQRAEVRLDANPDRLFTGRVTELGRVFHPKSPETPSVVFDATVSIDNPDPHLMRPGMAAEVTILPDGAGPEE